MAKKAAKQDAGAAEAAAPASTKDETAVAAPVVERTPTLAEICAIHKHHTNQERKSNPSAAPVVMPVAHNSMSNFVAVPHIAQAKLNAENAKKATN